MRIAALLVSLALGGSAAAQPHEDRATRLVASARALPDVSPDEAEVAARAALFVETRELPAELLIAIAWGESRFVSSTVTGHACGPMQTIARSRRECEAMKIPLVGFALGVRELKSWLRLARGDLYLALLGQACGVSALRGTCSKSAWPSWVLHRARALGLRIIGVGPKS